MSPFTEKVIATAGILALTFFLWGCYAIGQELKHSRLYQIDQVTEDSAGWDCHTMGNEDCG